MKKNYRSPTILSEESFETSALACGKTPQIPPGSHHFYSAYDTFTGHLGPAMAGNDSAIGSAGVGYGPGGTSNSYFYSGLCVNWVSLNT